MRHFLVLLFVMFVTVCAEAAEIPRILLVVGNGTPQTRIGFDMGELAQAHAVFALNGFGTDIASPAGGAVHAKEDEPSASIAAFLADGDASRKLAQTLRVSDADPSRYAAVFLIGGSSARCC